MKCKRCGAVISDDMQFCGECGYPNIGAGNNTPMKGNKHFSKNIVIFISVFCVIALAAGASAWFLINRSSNPNTDTDTNSLPAPAAAAANDQKQPDDSAGNTSSESDSIAMITQPPISIEEKQKENAGNVPSNNKENNNIVKTYFVAYCNEYITLRSAPSTSASELAKIPLGQAVGYIETADNGFYKISYDGKIGYALASYLSQGEQSTAKTAKVVNAKEFITLRSSPSTSASEITKIPAGAYVTYIGPAENGFYEIEYNGLRGYGLQSYLEITE